ncbi:MAG TPA: right-handed parallel beta-helix repeat-containing protein [Ohtaekwangia sp.]|nr:right-handed parallel beta-helix repeat-containing protein [Ohtaekwangia sp.]
MKSDAITFLFRKICGAVFLIALLSQCSEDEQMLATEKSISDSITATADASPTAVASCETCTYIVPSNTYRIDGAALGLKPGAVVCLKAGNQYKTILFVNFVGTASNPITIMNCGGRVTVDGAGKSFGIKTENSKYFRITGGSDATYGIFIKNANLGITLDKLSTNFEVDHVEVANVGFAGIMAKTDPSCDNATIRGNFTMRDISLHDNYIHETGGEGFYVGNSFYMNGVKLSCGTRFPHAIEGVKIYNNKVKNSGWEGIQLGSATVGAEVYNNSIENYGTKNVANQRNGLQLGEGTGGLCYNNFVKAGPGNGIVLLGLGDNVIHDNIIVNAGSHGIFCDERYSPGPGFKFVNNTIINPKQDGIRIYADLVPMNVIINNIIVNPGSYGSYKSPRTGDDAYVYKLSKNVKLQMSNNHFTRDINAVKFINASGSNYRLTSASPVLNKGKDVNTYNIATDFYKQSRVKGSAVDIGASEY